MAHIYPKNDPHWVQAEEVEAATQDGGFVNVKVNGLHYFMHRVEWHDPFFNKEKSDVLVLTPGGSWLRVWFFNKDVKPFEPKPDSGYRPYLEGH